MNTTIRWPRAERLLFLGRNGYGLCTGLDIFEFEGVVELRPITSKDRIGRAEICVPIAALPRLLQALKGIRRPKKRFQVRPSAHVK
jgi:hypothetical protein